MKTQTETFHETLEAMERSSPKAFDYYSSRTPDALAMRAAISVPTSLGDEPFYKPHPFGACYIIADFNWANNYYACTLITDKALQTACIAASRQSYCDAIDLCGGAK